MAGGLDGETFQSILHIVREDCQAAIGLRCLSARHVPVKGMHPCDLTPVSAVPNFYRQPALEANPRSPALIVYLLCFQFCLRSDPVLC